MAIGTFYFGYVENPGQWTLNEGGGERTFTTWVPFDVVFSAPPQVALALSGVDAGNQANLRVTLTPTEIGVDGFTLQVGVWADTVLYSVWGTWIAELA